MSLLKTTTSDKAKAGGDTLGGFSVFKSDAYEAIVKMLYVGQAKSGAKFLGIHLTIDGKEYREQVYFTNKNGENFYTKNNEDHILPGYQNADELCLLTTGKHLEDQDVEEKIVRLYDATAGAETNQSVPVLVEALNQPIVVGLIHELVNKQVKNGEGVYVNAVGQDGKAETREQNQINKFFHAETQGTVTEYTNEMELGKFYQEWVAANKDDKPKNRVKAVQGGATGAPGRPGATGGTGGETKSLFNRK